MRYLIDNVAKRIAPYWPLDTFVAVNPFWGWIDHSFEETAIRLKQYGGVNLFMPPSYYLEKINNGLIKEKHLEIALNRFNPDKSVSQFLMEIEASANDSPQFPKFPLLTEIADQCFHKDWFDLMKNETSARYAVYFNRFEDLKPVTGFALFRQWRKDAMIDRMPELHGMKKFRTFCQSLSRDMYKTAEFCLSQMNLDPEWIEPYLHTLAWTLPGWASYLAGLDWNAHFEEKAPHYTQALIVTLLCWEAYIAHHFPQLLESWKKEIQNALDYYQKDATKHYFQTLAILQYALELSIQDQILYQLFTSKNLSENHSPPRFQLAFCIDVRSEIIRRHLENVNPGIETIGMAGFFGVPIKFYPINHRFGKKQCPVLVKPQYVVRETLAQPKTLPRFLLQKRIQDGFRHFKLKYKIGVVSGFSYVSPLGLYYLPKLITDSLGLTRPLDDPKTIDIGNLIEGKTTLDVRNLSLAQRVTLAKSIIQTMGIQKRLAPLVLFIGHGSESVNNPHASSLDCGACGGNSGEVNALLSALILNDPHVRSQLAQEGIEIPETTFFWAGRHHTVTDEIEIFYEQAIPSTHKPLLEELKSSIQKAASLARKERLNRFQFEPTLEERIFFWRKQDWSQVRPEWGLAGCHTFIAAPRSLTKNLNLEGKVFLHNYDSELDSDFSLLETILTAPMVVASWICTQYYASVVDPEKLGAGNKVLHNPISGIGVLEGSTGDLKIGLPLQSVFDGKQFQHIPVRLNVFIAAPITAIQKIIDKHTTIQNLLHNHWLYLFAIEKSNQIYKYDKTKQWKPISIIA